MLLWTLLVCQIAASIYFFSLARSMEREASALSGRESEIRNKADQERTRLESETDMQELHRLAVDYRYRVAADWLDYRDRLHHMSGVMWWLSVLPAISSAVLAYIIYGLRIQNRAV